MSKSDQPSYCPYCGAGILVKWDMGCKSSLWYCESCQVRSAVLAVPISPAPAPSEPPERTDLIAKAYRGQLSVDEALLLAECLVWRTRTVVKHGKPYKTAVCAPESEGPISGLEITP